MVVVIVLCVAAEPYQRKFSRRAISPDWWRTSQTQVTCGFAKGRLSTNSVQNWDLIKALSKLGESFGESVMRISPAQVKVASFSELQVVLDCWRVGRRSGACRSNCEEFVNDRKCAAIWICWLSLKLQTTAPSNPNHLADKRVEQKKANNLSNRMTNVFVRRVAIIRCLHNWMQLDRRA